MKSFPVFLILGGFLLSGCATSYDSGMNVMQYSPNLWRISFNGNRFTDSQRAQDFALLRASEITIESGQRYFAILSDNESVSTAHIVVPGHAYTTGNAEGTVNGTTYGNNFYGNADMNYSANTTYIPPRDIVVRFPHSTMFVRVLTNEVPNSFDAQFLTNQIVTRYHVKFAAKRSPAPTTLNLNDTVPGNGAETAVKP